MKAPEKIYLQVCGDCPINDCEDCKFERDNVTWCKDRIYDNDIEYTRTDAFIEKAETFIYSALNDGIMGTANIENFMRLFKNYMKGE